MDGWGDVKGTLLCSKTKYINGKFVSRKSKHGVLEQKLKAF